MLKHTLCKWCLTLSEEPDAVAASEAVAEADAVAATGAIIALKAPHLRQDG